MEIYKNEGTYMALKKRHPRSPCLLDIRYVDQAMDFARKYGQFHSLYGDSDLHNVAGDAPWKYPFQLHLLKRQIPHIQLLRMAGEARNTIGLDPILAEMIRLSLGKTPSIPYDLSKVKHLKFDFPGNGSPLKYPQFVLVEGKYILWDDWNDPSELPYGSQHFYYNPGDWSAISRMKQLKQLVLSTLFFENFEFLRPCKSLETLDLSNTNFSDCRLLSELPNLKQVNLHNCSLEHVEELDTLLV